MVLDLSFQIQELTILILLVYTYFYCFPANIVIPKFLLIINYTKQNLLYFDLIS